MTLAVDPARKGEPVAAGGGVDGLYKAHIADAVRLAYLITGDSARAEDVAHDAFLRAAGRLGAIRHPDRVGAYLRTTVVRQVLMDRRSDSRERARGERTARAERVDDSTAAAIEHLDLVAALKRLPVRQRAVIVLRYWQDMTEADIARVLRCRPGTVKSALSRGLAALRAQGGIDD